MCHMRIGCDLEKVDVAERPCYVAAVVTRKLESEPSKVKMVGSFFGSPGSATVNKRYCWRPSQRLQDELHTGKVWW